MRVKRTKYLPKTIISSSKKKRNIKWQLFGFSITRAKNKDPKQNTTTQADDGTQTIAAGGYFGQYLDMEGTAKSEDLIRRYREIALHPECDMAIEDIVNEAIVSNEMKDAVRVNVII